MSIDKILKIEDIFHIKQLSTETFVEAYQNGYRIETRSILFIDNDYKEKMILYE